MLPEQWPDGDVSNVPPGYHEIATAFHGPRAFCLGSRNLGAPPVDAELLARVRAWVDLRAQEWSFGRVFAARDLNFWAFLRDRLVSWLHELMVERRALEHLAGDEDLVVLAAGIDPYRRLLLKAIAEVHKGRFHPEIAYLAEPIPPAAETAAERRFRKLFFLVQDAWHGMQFLVEDLLIRRPKVLLVSDSRCWQRRRADDGGWARTDVHLEAVWREGRQRPLRLYYRSDSYHPDVGAMTAGKLAPTYLRHFLFILAQTSRGYWETRRIQRNWRGLQQKEGFRASLVFEGLPLGELMCAWLDQATAEKLPTYVRDTRRESHFLRGIRPDVILLTNERETNRSVLAAARRLGIPTVALQLTPYPQWEGSYMAPPPDDAGEPCLPDRLCVFTPQGKARLVEKGALAPAEVVVTGDPRLDVMATAHELDAQIRHRLRSRWGVEAEQKVVALACEPHERSWTLDWLGRAAADRSGVFVLIRSSETPCGEEGALRRVASSRGLRWVELISPQQLRDGYDGIDLLLVTSATEMAEGLLRRKPVVFLHPDPEPRRIDPDPGGLVQWASSAPELRQFLAEGVRAPAADTVWESYIDAVFGPRRQRPAQRVVETLMDVLHQD